MDTKYTVLLPVYYKDKAKYLNIAIDSVIKQSVKPSELIILVDGNIGDELKGVIEYYNINFDYVIVKYFPENRGLGKVLHDGVLLARNELIGRMDADDICLFDRFENQLMCFTLDESMSLVGSHIKEFSFDLEEMLKERKVPCSCEQIKKYSKIRNPFNHMSVMFKKSDVIEVGNYLDMPLFEDYYLWIRLIRANKKVCNIDRVLMHVRAGDDMVARRSGFGYLKKEYYFQKELLKIDYINKFEFTRNVILRGLPRVLPNSILNNMYSNLLRK